jgi:hypothetical protein
MSPSTSAAPKKRSKPPSANSSGQRNRPINPSTKSIADEAMVRAMLLQSASSGSIAI